VLPGASNLYCDVTYNANPTTLIATRLLYVMCWSYTSVTEIFSNCQPFCGCTSLLPRSVTLFSPPLFASKSRWLSFYNGHHLLSTAVWLRLRQQPAAGDDHLYWVSRYYWISQSKRNIAQYPIHLNTSQYWPISNTPMLVLFKPYPWTIKALISVITLLWLTVWVGQLCQVMWDQINKKH